MHVSRLSYYRRVMGAMVVVLLSAIALVRWWPSPSSSSRPDVFREQPTDPITLREVQPTRQSEEKTPAPPAPLPPVVVPNDVLVKEKLKIGEGELQVDTPENDEKLQDGADRATAARQPDTGARLLRNVQPNYPEAARENEVRARIEVEVEIAANGRVTDAHIRRRWLLSETDTPQPVSTLGHGLEDAALTAARRSLFRPARADGRPVSTRTVLTFTFGPD